MAITRNNYEAWFVDRLDGQLDAASCEAMDRFLEKHADLAAEWASWSGDAWQTARVEPVAEAPFTQRESLYRRPQANRRIVAWWAAAAVAASLVIGWFVVGMDDAGSPKQATAVESKSNAALARESRADEERNAALAQENRADEERNAALVMENRADEEPDAARALVDSADQERDAVEKLERATRSTNELPLAPGALAQQQELDIEAPSAKPVPLAGTKSAHIETDAMALASQEEEGASITPKLLPDRAANSPARILEPIPAAPLQNGNRFDDAAYSALAQARVLEPSNFTVSDETNFPRVESFLDRLPPRLQRAGEKTVDAVDGLAEAIAGEDPLVGRRENQQYIFEFEAGPLRITHRKTPKSES